MLSEEGGGSLDAIGIRNECAHGVWGAQLFFLKSHCQTSFIRALVMSLRLKQHLNKGNLKADAAMKSWSLDPATQEHAFCQKKVQGVSERNRQAAAPDQPCAS